jgi:Fe-S-cluster containining protein
LRKVGFSYPLNVAFGCSLCALCCGDTKEKVRHIVLLESEVDSISAETSLPKQQFSEQTDKPLYPYEMKKPHEGKCFFLKDNRCSIYCLRPLICRFYPFELTFSQDKGMYVFDFTVECPGINKGRAVTRKDFEELFSLARERLG